MNKSYCSIHLLTTIKKNLYMNTILHNMNNYVDFSFLHRTVIVIIKTNQFRKYNNIKSNYFLRTVIKLVYKLIWRITRMFIVCLFIE